MPKAPTLASQKKLVERFNAAYKVGDKMKVEQDSGLILEWTVAYPASLMGGHTAMIWPEEHRGAYLASRVQFPKA